MIIYINIYIYISRYRFFLSKSASGLDVIQNFFHLKQVILLSVKDHNFMIHPTYVGGSRHISRISYKAWFITTKLFEK